MMIIDTFNQALDAYYTLAGPYIGWLWTAQSDMIAGALQAIGQHDAAELVINARPWEQ